MTKRLQSLHTRLLASVLLAAGVAMGAVMALTALGVSSYLHSRLQNQVHVVVSVLVDVLGRAPVPTGPPPEVSNRREYFALVVDPAGHVLQYLGSFPANVPAPPIDLIRSMAADHSTRPLPGSDFLEAAGVMPNGSYVVAGLSRADYKELLTRTLVLEGGLSLVVLGVLVVVLFHFSRNWLSPLKSVVLTARRIADGDLSHRVEVARSTYEVHSLTRSFNTMLARLQDSFTTRQHAEDRLRQFVAAAGHELRTPLAAISGYAQLAQLGALDDPGEFHQAMRRVCGETRRMTALVDELLMLARLDRGRPSETEPVDLGPLCLDAVHDAHAAGPEWPLRHVVDGRQYLVSGDAFRLRQVVTNLLANIRAHTPRGTTARLELSSTADGLHVIDIVDDGPGIPADLRERVFERFFRAHPAAESSGLGLSIVAELVACHGGTIRVLPTERGTWLRVQLPALTGTEQPAPGIRAESLARHES